ncbi:MAG: hypothetical protein WC223_01385 [Bacteroidales bacterium]|jgi:glutathione synthase/RimK-type ligase-like ATP-grasp enzyme
MKKILIIAKKDDIPVLKVIEEIQRMGHHVLFFDLTNFPKTSNLSLDNINSKTSGFIDLIKFENFKKTKYRALLEDIGIVWHIRPGLPVASNVVKSDGVKKFIENESRVCLQNIFASANFNFVNHPLFTKFLEDGKFYPLKIAEAIGLNVPKTIITNDPEKLIKFSNDCNNKIIVKLLHGTVLKDKKDFYFIYANKIKTSYLKKEKENIKLSPIMAQEYIEKKTELRLTVIGKKIFTCAIDSQASEKTRIDWRKYDFAKVKHYQYFLSENIKKKIIKLMDKLNLNYGTIDLIITPNNDYFFLEVNPSGQWGWIEEITGINISQGIAKYLISRIKNT